jgi:NAD-dependent deacetylase
MDQISLLQEYIDQSDDIVFFGGAGVSTESGIPDFRSVDGLYNQKYAYPPEQILSHAFFCTHRAEFFRFYRDKVLAPDARPNAAHFKLAALESAGRLSAVITQNIDGLHQAAGSRNVIELHGSALRNYCIECGRFFGAQYVLQAQDAPICPCGGAVKPDVVLYGEGLDQAAIQSAIRHIGKCQLLIVGGTSLSVYPAAGLLDYFRGRHIAVVNRTHLGDRRVDLFIQGSIGQVLSKIRVPAGA